MPREGAWEKVKGHAERVCARTPTRATSTGPASNAELQKARPNLSQHQLIDTYTDVWALFFFFFKSHYLALMWAITGLLFMAASCR